MSKPTKSTKPASRPRAPRRDLGVNSKLGQLPQALKAGLLQRLQSPMRYDEIKRWLTAEHGVKTSDTALSMFWNRNKKREPLSEAGPAPFPALPFEVQVSAPGASSISIRFIPVAPGTKPQ